MTADGVYTDYSGTWITENGWCRREKNGHPYFITCNVCEAPVMAIQAGSGMCLECIEFKEDPR